MFGRVPLEAARQTYGMSREWCSKIPDVSCRGPAMTRQGSAVVSQRVPRVGAFAGPRHLCERCVVLRRRGRQAAHRVSGSSKRGLPTGVPFPRCRPTSPWLPLLSDVILEVEGKTVANLVDLELLVHDLDEVRPPCKRVHVRAGLRARHLACAAPPAGQDADPEAGQGNHRDGLHEPHGYGKVLARRWWARMPPRTRGSRLPAHAAAHASAPVSMYTSVRSRTAPSNGRA